MVCTKTEKKLVLLMYFWLWWSTTPKTSSSMQHVKAEDTNDSLKAGHSTSILYSKQGKYWLGFHQTNDNNDTFLIIFNAEEPQEVWLSDRNLPADPNAVLSLDQYGVLKIEPGCPKEPGNPKYPKEPGQPKCPKEPGYPREPGYRKEPIILYSPSDQANNTLARLLDTGNFVLQQLHPNGTVTVLWQSFDYPAYTLLPTMKLGFNRITGHNWSLVSPLTSSLSAPGAFSLEWDPKARELVMKRRGKACWRSGKLNESSGMFENIPEEVQGGYEYTVDEDSFTLKTKNHDEEKFMGWILTETGQLRSSAGFIARGDKCYGYNSTGGCERWEDIPTCREAGDEFRAKVSLPNGHNTSFDYNRSYGTSDCRAICWSHCSCRGFTAIFPNETGCRFFQWNSTGDAQIDDMEDDFFVQTVTSNLYVLVKAARNSGNGTGMTALPAHHSGGKGTKKWIWIGAVVVALLIISSSILCLALKEKIYGLKEKKRREANILDLADSNEFASAKDLEDYLKNRHDIKVFNCSSILAATNGFSPENKLGQGGFGPVYKGILSTGQEVAVKRLSKTSRQGVVEFKNELTFICELQHTNLVQILGCCIHDKERILIYEYMPNKSLDFYLFDCTRSKLLDWRKRSNIIEGISQGLLYLHKYSRLKVIHRDLKASNILLDENMNPKISDFGMARMFPQQESMVNTNRIVGTYGYMSPEYAMGGICSMKSDVYSFGVLLLEIVSGRRNNSFYDANRPLNLIGHAWELWHEGECLKLVDPALNDTFPLDEVQRCIQVGLLCVEQHANDRPTMSKVISMLTNKSLVVALPRRPAFYVAASNILEGTTSSKMSDITLTHEVSISSEVE